MGWMQDQIKERIRKDEEMYAMAYKDLASVVVEQQKFTCHTENIHANQKALLDILLYYHIKIKNEDISIEFLEARMKNEHIMRRKIQLKGKWYKEAHGVLLVFDAQDDAYALIPHAIRGYYRKDIVTGKKQYIRAKEAALFQSDAYCFYCPLPHKELQKKDILAYVKQQIQGIDVIFLFVSIVSIVLIGLYMPMIQEYIFSNIIQTKSTSLLMAVLVVMISMSISTTFIEFIKRNCSVAMETKLSLNLSASFMMRMIQLPTSFFKEYGAGELAERLEYIEALCHSLISLFLTSFITMLCSFLYIIQIGYYAPSLLWISIGYILAQILLMALLLCYETKVLRKQYTYENKETNLVFALLSGIQKVRNAGAEKRAFAKWANAYTLHAKARYQLPFLVKISPVLFSFISFVSMFLIYLQAEKQGVGISSYIAFQSAFGFVSASLLSLSKNIRFIALIKPIMELCTPVLKAIPESNEKKQSDFKLLGNIELNNVTFRYEDHLPPILENVSLQIRNNQYIGIVGESGCGKSTFMRLLLGFEKTQKGAIYYDGKDMNTLDTTSLRKNIGVVLQDGKLFQGDMYSNISISNPNMSMEEAWEVAHKAGIGGDIALMPMKMRTLISEGGRGLSGGQQQRLLIARAIASKPKILLMDEATSALDNVTQKMVSESLEQLRCTRIVIAHRLSTIQHCDRILVLKDGKFIEDGTYEELMNKDGVFKDLVSRQQMM